jgi:hypothetical protein
LRENENFSRGERKKHLIEGGEKERAMAKERIKASMPRKEREI